MLFSVIMLFFNTPTPEGGGGIGFLFYKTVKGLTLLVYIGLEGYSGSWSDKRNSWNSILKFLQETYSEIRIII